MTSLLARSVSGLALLHVACLHVACSAAEPTDPTPSTATGGSGVPDGSGGAGMGGGGLVGVGTGGGASTGGSDPGDVSGVGCDGADLLCETFEDVAEGEVPTGGAWVALGDSCQYTTNFSSGVASDQPRGGSTKALKFTNHQNTECRLSANFGAVDDFWIRAHIFWDSTVSFAGKELLAVDLRPDFAANPSDDPALRFGSRTKEPCTGSPGGQITMIGWGEEQTGCDGDQPLPTGEWYCFEAHVQQGTELSAVSYINGNALSYDASGKETRDAISLSAMPSGSTVSPKVTHIRLGMFANDSSGKGDVWIDDVAVATSRIGCGD